MTLALVAMLAAAAPEGMTQVDGGVADSLLRESIRQVMHTRRHDIRRCWEARRSSGKLTVSFFVEPDGSTSSIEATDETNDAPLRACVVGVVKPWRFDVPKGSPRLQVNYPMIFCGSGGR